VSEAEKRKHVVSVSLGSSSRNKCVEVEILGTQFFIERIGTDGDLRAFSEMFTKLDGQVDALGVGGADIFVVVGDRKYEFRQISKLVSGTKNTPVVDGSGLKHTLERATIEFLQEQGIVDFRKESALLVSAVDRFGMAQALDKIGGRIVYGDLLFGMGVPIPIRSYTGVKRIGKLLLPIVTRLPFKWFYPTGQKQEIRKPKFPKIWNEATVIAGDTLLIKRFAAENLQDKTIITQTVRKADLEWMRKAGVRRVITTTPVMGGETFATNVMEAVLVVLIGKPLGKVTEEDYLQKLRELHWRPNVMDLTQD